MEMILGNEISGYAIAAVVHFILGIGRGIFSKSTSDKVIAMIIIIFGCAYGLNSVFKLVEALSNANIIK